VQALRFYVVLFMCFSLSPPYLPMRACIACVCVCVCVVRVSPSCSLSTARYNAQVGRGHFHALPVQPTRRHRRSLPFLDRSLVPYHRSRGNARARSRPIDLCGIVYCVAEPRLAVPHLRIDA